MIVCHCRGVSDRTIREAVRRGARSLREVSRACDVGRCCGGCVPLVRQIVTREIAASEPAPAEPLPVAAAS